MSTQAEQTVYRIGHKGLVVEVVGKVRGEGGWTEVLTLLPGYSKRTWAHCYRAREDAQSAAVEAAKAAVDRHRSNLQRAEAALAAVLSDTLTEGDAK